MKTSIYLPDELAEQVRALGIPMSEVVQAALRKAVAEAEALAQAKAQIDPDIELAVVRLRRILAKEEAAKESERTTGRGVGVLWARDYASPRELKEMTSTSPPRRVSASHSLHDFCDDQTELTGHVNLGPKFVLIEIEEKPWWAGFRQGAAKVWEAVLPILEHETQP